MGVLRDQYEKEVVPALMKKFNYKSVMQVPRLEKVVINIGLGDTKENPKSLENAVNDLTLITGQKPVITKAKKAIAAFKIREGINMGCKVTLRKNKMYDFTYKLFNVALPRVRDFRGLSTDSFDGRGNYSMGIKEQLIFPEIEYDKVDKIRGMDIIFVTTAKTDEEARELYRKVSNILNMDMCKLCFETSMEELSKTENTQIAIATVSLSILEVLRKRGIKAKIATGLSLGEYVALMYSGILTIEDGMKLLKQRGYLMGNLVPDEKYAMAAVIGLKASIIEEMCNKKIMEGKFVVPANYNYSGQIVISGNEETIEECIEEFKEKGAKKVIKLKTSGPFHTIKLQKASEEFAKCLQNVQFNEPKVDIIKNLDGRIYSKEDNINQILEKHIISPVRFDKAIDLMKDIGIDAYVEIGPGKALSGFVKRELEDANVYTLNNLDSLNKFLENFE